MVSTQCGVECMALSASAAHGFSNTSKSERRWWLADLFPRVLHYIVEYMALQVSAPQSFQTLSTLRNDMLAEDGFPRGVSHSVEYIAWSTLRVGQGCVFKHF